MGCAQPHPFHWEDLRARPREEVLSLPGVTALPEGAAYQVGFLNALYLVDPQEERIEETSPWPRRPLSKEFQILLIRYLLAPHGGKLTGELVSEKDFPGGSTFFQGPHAMPVDPVVRRYGAAAQAFVARGLELGAEQMALGDVSLTFYPFPLIPVTYVLWEGDEEFPPSVTCLFDRSVSKWFEFDMIFTLVRVLTERIVEAGAAGATTDPRHTGGAKQSQREHS
ncbi:MAG: DUF3786 domain-containing protein [Desulfomonilaceae bacterium]